VAADNDMSVDVIDGGEYDALKQCIFTTDHQKTFLQQFYPGSIQLLMGPPQPIRAVSCLGTCVDNGDWCYHDGRSVGECCNGYCNSPGDGKCHAWSDLM
jgi:hypothetical protein